MVIDTSALLAVLLQERSASRIATIIDAAISDDIPRLLSAANYVEATIVIERRRGDGGARELEWLLYRTSLEIVPVDRDQAEIARAAWRRFGKTRHPAALNYGDCFAYALAKSRGLPLLFAGNDFSQTDIESVRLE